MGSAYDKKFTWVIKNFCTLQGEKVYSNQFVAGFCNWRFVAQPKDSEGYNFLSVYLETAADSTLAKGWKRHVKVRFSIPNQFEEKLSRQREMQQWYEADKTSAGFHDILSLSELHDVKRGFLVNGEITIVGEVKILEVVGNLDVGEETSLVTESVDFNGFHIHFAEIEFVKSLFRKQPNIALRFRPQNRLLKTAYMNLLLAVLKVVSLSVTEISMECFRDVDRALGDLRDAGFDLEWLRTDYTYLVKRKEDQMLAEDRIHAIEIEADEKRASTLEIITQLEAEKENLVAETRSFRLDGLL